MKLPKALSVSKRGGFTLVELLVVITIIVILTGLTLGAMGWVQKKAAVDKCRAQIALLENGLEQFHADHGFYPEGTTSLVVYQALFGDGITPEGTFRRADGKPDEGMKVYVPDLDPNTNSSQIVKLDSRGRPSGLIDPFGNDYNYRGGAANKASMNNPDFDLWSKGPDGKDRSSADRADDIMNW